MFTRERVVGLSPQLAMSVAVHVARGSSRGYEPTKEKNDRYLFMQNNRSVKME
jgi:hypothetical protein